MGKSIRRIAVDLLGRVGYFPIIRPLVTASPVPTKYEFIGSRSVSLNCNLYGDIRIDEGARVDGGTTVRGRLTLERGSRLGPDSKVEGCVDIGKHTNLNGQHQIVGTVDIGSYCAIAPTVEFYLVDHFKHQAGIQHDFYEDIINEPLPRVDKGPAKVGNDVWIGRHTMVLSGIEVGDGAIIGAGSIVTKDVEPYEIVAGSPAEHRGWRFPESVRESLSNIEWWEWSEEKIKRNKKFFTSNLREVEHIHSLIVE